MEFIKFNAGPDDDGRRFDRIIRKICGENLSGIYKAIRKGLIKLNGKKADSSVKVSEGDVIEIAEFLLSNNKTELKNEEKNTDKGLDIIYRDKNFIILNKKYDSTVHGSSQSIDKSVVKWYENSSIKSASISFVPGPLHRLDRKTTGILAFSLSLNGARWFSENIASHRIKKTYLAVLEGKLPRHEHWEDFIKRNDEADKNAFHSVTAAETEDSDSKKAITDVTPVKHFCFSGKACTLAEINIGTGRTHQIRAQSALHGFPLLGDTAYGGSKINSEQDFYLHACRLEFPEDRPEGLPKTLEAPLPEAFNNFLFLLQK